MLKRVHSRLQRLLEQPAEQAADEDPERTNQLLAYLAAFSIHGQAATGDELGQSLPALLEP